MPGSAANLSGDQAAAPTVHSHKHHIMLAYGDQMVRQNETYTPVSTLSSPLTDSKKEGGHGLALNHLFTV